MRLSLTSFFPATAACQTHPGFLYRVGMNPQGFFENNEIQTRIIVDWVPQREVPTKPIIKEHVPDKVFAA